MNRLAGAAMLFAVMGLGACTDQARFGGSTSGGPGAESSQLGDPADPADPASIAYFHRTVGDRVLFAVDVSELDDTARAVLDGQSDWLNANPEYTVLIEGHADERGTREYNLALGARRANSVHEYLVSRGVAANRLRVVSYGKERPVEICSNESCYLPNRRAVSVVTADIPSV